MTIHTMCNQVYAQDKSSSTKTRYIIEVDSQFIKATPYEITFENGKEIHHDEHVEWYTDMSIYEFKPKEIDEKGIVLKTTSSLKPTIFLLSGGGFTSLDNQQELNPSNTSLSSNLKLASKLANERYNVFWINYQIETNLIYKLLIGKLFINTPNDCIETVGSQAKARIEHASLKSFRDFRVKFNNIISDPTKNVDPDNVFISGISAGAFLSIYSVFLDQDEIPGSISYTNCSSSNISIVTIGSSHALRIDGYPMPSIKGIIPLAGGSLFNNIFNKTTHSNNTAVNFLHGTCDELINQNEGKVSYKLLEDTEPMIVEVNSNDLYRYPYAYGSKYLYNILTTNHDKIGFGQVINGGHGVINSISNADIQKNGGWDIHDASNLTSNLSLRDPVFDNISTFMKRVMGITGYPSWINHTYSVFPDLPTSGCLLDDLSLINSPLTTSSSICINTNTTATISNTPTWTTITWSVSSNLQIIGSNTGTSITYKGTSAGTGTITATVSYGTESFKKIVINKNVLVKLGESIPTPIPTTTGFDELCMSGNKTLTLTNLPSSYTSINWTKTGGLTIISQSGPTVTYKRSGLGGGILTATIETSCETKSFNFNIKLYPNLTSTYSNIFGFTGICENSLVNEGDPIVLQTNSTFTFSVNYTNADFNGITGAEWDFGCGTILSGPTHTWVGSTLKSQITIKTPTSALGSCSYIKVRPTNPCSSGSIWREHTLSLGSCGGGWLLLSYPNPTSDDIYFTLSHDDNKKLLEKYQIYIVDVVGNTVMSTFIENGNIRISTRHLNPGHYQAIIYTDNEVIKNSFIVKK